MKKNIALFFALLVAACSFNPAYCQKAPRIFLNPGHGGHDSNDRPTPLRLVASGDSITYYESDSNFATGEGLIDYLEKKGYEMATTRHNNTSDDDLDLFEIVALAANSGADLFFSVHSNATGVKKRLNFPLTIFRGYDNAPAVAGSDSLARAVARHLRANEASVWTHRLRVAGDWSFYYNWGYKTGLGVLRYNKLPGLLCEGSFFDYMPERCRKLNADFCRLEAWNQSLGIDEYFGRSQKGKTGVVAGVARYDCERADTSYIAFEADLKQPANQRVVVLRKPNGQRIAHYLIDNLNNGFYMFDDLKPGRYLLTIEGSNYRREVVVKANASSYCNFVIAK